MSVTLTDADGVPPDGVPPDGVPPDGVPPDDGPPDDGPPDDGPPYGAAVVQLARAPRSATAVARLAGAAGVALVAAALFGATRLPWSGPPPSEAPDGALPSRADSAAGAYLLVSGGCNDCHTGTWARSDGRTPPAEQLTGDSLGFRGPWGTTYPANLRLLASQTSEDGWVRLLHTARAGTGRPPMPWMNTRQMRARDLRLMHRYLRRLGPAGRPAPAFVPPGVEPGTPHLVFVPQPPARRSAAARRAPAGPAR